MHIIFVPVPAVELQFVSLFRSTAARTVLRAKWRHGCTNAIRLILPLPIRPTYVQSYYYPKCHLRYLSLPFSEIKVLPHPPKVNWHAGQDAHLHRAARTAQFAGHGRREDVGLSRDVYQGGRQVRHWPGRFRLRHPYPTRYNYMYTLYIYERVILTRPLFS